jgi:hypothetical protein
MLKDNDLTDRVTDIEQTIGDINQVLEALRNCLLHLPTCPPYCAQGVDSKDVDERSIKDQVGDMGRGIGDLSAVFARLREVLDSRAQPTCPPYCSHSCQEAKE